MQNTNIYCPDCRGRFQVDLSGVEERDTLECSLCMAEIEVLQLSPLKLRLYEDE